MHFFPFCKKSERHLAISFDVRSLFGVVSLEYEEDAYPDFLFQM